MVAYVKSHNSNAGNDLRRINIPPYSTGWFSMQVETCHNSLFLNRLTNSTIIRLSRKTGCNPYIPYFLPKGLYIKYSFFARLVKSFRTKDLCQFSGKSFVELRNALPARSPSLNTPNAHSRAYSAPSCNGGGSHGRSMHVSNRLSKRLVARPRAIAFVH